MDLTVVPLHKHTKYIEQCCTLINEQWKRSITARMRCLESSCDTLPISLIMLKDDNVIGHGRISPIPSIPDACFVESVVVKSDLRGKGYGKYLMRKTEEYCKDTLNLKTIYLSTYDQEIFYSKLGYNICQPISIYGSSNMAMNGFPVHNSSIKGKNGNKGPIPPPLPNLNPNVQRKKIYMNKIL